MRDVSHTRSSVPHLLRKSIAQVSLPQGRPEYAAGLDIPIGATLRLLFLVSQFPGHDVFREADFFRQQELERRFRHGTRIPSHQRGRSSLHFLHATTYSMPKLSMTCF